MNLSDYKCLDNKINSLQTVRAFAFFGIFYCHCGTNIFGAWGVSVFVLLSGFLMTYRYYEKEFVNISFYSNLHFAINKIKSLYPLHILMLLAAFPLVIHALASNYSLRLLVIYIGEFFLNIVLLQDYIPNTGVGFSWNGVAWYLSLCLFLYFSFPFILKQIRKIRSVLQAITVALLIYVLQCIVGFLLQYICIPINFVDNFSKWVTYILPVFRLGDFTIGCCFGYVFFNMKRSYRTGDSALPNIKRYGASILEIIIITVIFINEYIYKNQIGVLGSESFRYNMLYTPSSICLIYVFALNGQCH